MPKVDPKTRRSVIDLFRGYQKEMRNNLRRIGEIQEENRIISHKADDCIAAARLFGIEMSELAFEEKKKPSKKPVHKAPQSNKTPQLPLPDISSKPFVIKDYISTTAEKTYPKPIRASQIRTDLKARNIPAHEKTIGMTLYRMSLKGVVKRTGLDWYFVPANKREEQKPATKKLA